VFWQKNDLVAILGTNWERFRFQTPKTTPATTFWDLFFDLLLHTFSHFAGTDFSLIFNVLVYQVWNEKSYPRRPKARPPRPILLLNLSKLRKVKPTIPFERYHKKHALRRRFARFLLCFYDDDSRSRFLEIPFPSFTIFRHFRVPISSQNLTKSSKSCNVFWGLEKIKSGDLVHFGARSVEESSRSRGELGRIWSRNVSKPLCFTAFYLATERFVSTKRERVSPSTVNIDTCEGPPGRDSPETAPTESLEKPPGTLQWKHCLGN